MELLTEIAPTKLAIKAKQVFHNLSPAELIEAALQNGEGVLTDTGALMCDTLAVYIDFQGDSFWVNL